MRIRRIDVEGSEGRRAELTRDGANVIACIYEDGDLVGNAHIVGASKKRKLRELARTVQREMGRQASVDEYHQLIRRLAQ